MSTNLDKLMQMATLEQLNNMIQQMNKQVAPVSAPLPLESKDVLSLPIVQKVILAYEDEIKKSSVATSCKCHEHLDKHGRQLQRIENRLEDLFLLLERQEKEPSYSPVVDKNQLKLSAFPGFCKSQSLSEFVMSTILLQENKLKTPESNENRLEQSLEQTSISQQGCVSQKSLPEVILPEEILESRCLPEEILESRCLPEEILESRCLPEEILESRCLPEEILESRCLPEEILPEECLESRCLEKENITLNIEEHDEDLVVEEKSDEEVVEEESDEEAVEEESDEEAVEDEVVEEESEEEDSEEEVATEEDSEEEVEEQTVKEEVVEEEEEEEEVFEIEIDDITYFATDEENGILYEVDKDGEVGKKVGIIKDGEPIFS
jgi:hypothetical protein